MLYFVKIQGPGTRPGTWVSRRVGMPRGSKCKTLRWRLDRAEGGRKPKKTKKKQWEGRIKRAARRSQNWRGSPSGLFCRGPINQQRATSSGTPYEVRVYAVDTIHSILAEIPRRGFRPPNDIPTQTSDRKEGTGGPGLWRSYSRRPLRRCSRWTKSGPSGSACTGTSGYPGRSGN